MVDLIRVESAEQSGVLNEYYITPDFSAFNKPVISWSLTYGYASEPHFTLEFAGLPLYNNAAIVIDQLVTIPIQDADPINMYVRSIHYALNDDSVTTVLTLKTALIFLDQYILGAVNLGNQKNAEAVFKGILAALELPSGFQTSAPIDWPSIADEITINGTETVLDWLNAQLGRRKKRRSKNPLNDKEPIFDWWFDIRNIMRVEQKFTAISQTLDLNLDTIRPIYISLDIEIADKVEKRSAPVGINASTPAKTKPIREVVVDRTGRQATIQTRRIAINDDNSVAQSSYQNFLIETKSVNLKLKGIHWLQEHEKLTLTNFPIANGEYIIETITLTHNATGGFTTIDLKAFELAMPLSELDEDDTSDNAKRPREVITNPAGTEAVIR